MSAHILNLLFPYDGTSAICTDLTVYKPMQVILRSEATGFQVILILIDSLYQIVRHTDIQGLSCIAMIFTAKLFSLIQPLYQKDSGQAGMTRRNEMYHRNPGRRVKGGTYEETLNEMRAAIDAFKENYREEGEPSKPLISPVKEPRGKSLCLLKNMWRLGPATSSHTAQTKNNF